MSETTTTTEAPTTFAKGSWQEQMQKSTAIIERTVKAKKQAGVLLWTGAQTAINEWLPGADDDVNAEKFSADVLAALGTSRKGDASKIKTVALAVRGNGLDLAEYDNLSKAYGAAVAVTKTAKVHVEEDNAAEEAIEAIEAPKTASAPDSAAALLLSKGLDGAVVAILDALGANNEAAHRSFMRAVATEVSSRVQAAKDKATAEAKAAKAAADAAKPKPEPKAKAGAKASTAKVATAKAKPVPTSASKGDPNKKALPAKAKPAAAKAAPAKAAPVKRAVPVKK